MKARILVFCLLAACAMDDADVGSDEPMDYEVDTVDGKADGVPATFNRNDVLGDDIFVNSGNMTVEEVQRFFEQSPYGNRSWLANHTVNGISAAQAVIDAAQQENVHPLMLIARMQVESSLVSKTTRPTQSRIDKALGCGCPDGAGCSSAYRGFDKQLVCGAKTMRKLYNASVSGTGQWRRGSTRRTLDPTSVTPVNHATASMYAYTPWVLVGRGGNWLVWNVTRKYVRHAQAEGFLD